MSVLKCVVMGSKGLERVRRMIMVTKAGISAFVFRLRRL